MKIRCTKCKSVYVIPDEKLEGKTGKVKVRCQNCRSVLAIRLKEKREAEAEPEWFYAVGADQKGPATLAELKAMFADSTLAADALVWKAGMAEWAPAAEIDELDLAELPAPEADPEDVMPPEPGEEFPERTMELGPDIDDDGAEDEATREESIPEDTIDEPAPEPVAALEEEPLPEPEAVVPDLEEMEEEPPPADGWTFVSLQLSSAHPYADQIQEYEVIEHPGASELKVHFEWLEGNTNGPLGNVFNSFFADFLSKLVTV